MDDRIPGLDIYPRGGDTRFPRIMQMPLIFIGVVAFIGILLVRAWFDPGAMWTATTSLHLGRVNAHPAVVATIQGLAWRCAPANARALWAQTLRDDYPGRKLLILPLAEHNPGLCPPPGLSNWMH